MKNTIKKTARKAASEADITLAKQLEALKKQLQEQTELAQTLEKANIDLVSQVNSGKQPKANSTFTASSLCIIAGIGKGYITLEQGSKALIALEIALVSNDDQSNKALKSIIASKIRHNILSNIKKQADHSKALTSIDQYIEILHTINTSVNYGIDINLDSARAEVETAHKAHKA